jgi:outer membrane protein insertion porin family
MKKVFLVISLICGLLLAIAVNAQNFTVSDIRIEGLQRVSAGAVFAALPINVGDQIDRSTVRNSIRSLFRTGNFDDVKINIDGSVLVVQVVERPSITEIKIEGNKAIETDSLLKGLEKSGLAEGQVFKRSTLESIRQELSRQYVAQGRYDATVDTDVVAQPRNRVAINITIDEGNTAAIKHINIVGNTVYTDDELISLFELKTTGWLSWLTSDDKYAREKLKGDLEKLSSYYLDRGYIQFKIDGTQVSIAPDKESIYITINISEGEKFNVGKVELSGDLILPEEVIRRFVLIQEDQLFSQALVTNSEELITQRLGNEGYNFAEVKGITDINAKDKIVNLKFFIDPGKRTYVRRIEMAGNDKTADDVLRREMRQMESAPASSSKIEQSKVRLERLGYFKEAKVDTMPVAGYDDLIDLKYTVEEQASGSIGASIGFSQDSGIILGANLEQSNFLGTGKNIGIGLSRSSYLTNIVFSYVNPYFTPDGVSRGFSVFYRKTDLDEVNVADYSTDSWGGTINFAYPLSEISQLGTSIGYTRTQIDTGVYAVQEIRQSPRLMKGVQNEYYTTLGRVNGTPVFPSSPNPPLLSPITQEQLSPNIVTDEPGYIDKYGDTFNDFPLNISWTQSTLNRGRLATRGASQSIGLEITIPGSDTEYYKLTYNGQLFIPLTQSLTLRLRGELGYGDGYGDQDGLPFYQNFFAGGFGSVRGFERNTLGPRSTPAKSYLNFPEVTDLLEASDSACGGDANGDGRCDGNTSRYIGEPRTVDYGRGYYLAGPDGKLYVSNFYDDEDPFGGNVLIEGTAEILFPLPFIKDNRSIRSTVFLDGGNVFSTDCGTKQKNCFTPDLGELVYSFGVGVTWITGFGPLSFSLAKPLKEDDFADSEVFQFSLGTGF